METTELDAAIESAAQRLLQATLDGVACAPIREFIGPDDLDAAYRVQELNTAAKVAAGAKITGRKIGLTSEAVQKQLGVGQPDFGVLFDDMDIPEGQPVPMSLLLQPKAEAEIAFILGADLAEGPLDDAQCRAAVAHAVPALEICDSRVEDWDIRFADTVADNASSGVYVLGTDSKTLDEFEPIDATMTTITGVS